MSDVITGEAVALELPVATFPSRIAAKLIDMLLQVLLLFIVLLFVPGAGARNGDYVAAVIIVAVVVVFVGYPTIMETATRGHTLGKMALGLRVIGDDGSPVRFRQALVRALVGVFEIWSILLAPVALITSVISARGKRVGDMFAGTYVIHERAPVRRPLPPEFTFVPAPLGDWAGYLQISALTDQTAEAAASYLRRFAELNPHARDALGVQLANAVAAQVSPPPPAGTPPAAYLAAVLAVRRLRQQAMLAAAQPALPTSPVVPALVPPAPVPTAPVPTAPVPTAPVPTAPVPPPPVPTAGAFVPPGSAAAAITEPTATASAQVAAQALGAPSGSEQPGPRPLAPPA